MDIIGGIWRGARFATKCTGFITECSGKLVGGAVEGTTWLAGKGVGFLNKRIGESIQHGGAALARTVEAPYMASSYLFRQGVNVAAKYTSRVFGSIDGEIEADADIDEANDKMTSHGREIISEYIKSSNKITGRAMFNRVKKYYKSVQADKQKRQKELNARRSKINGQIKREMRALNSCRQRASECFSRFETISRAVANWEIHRYDVKEDFKPVYFEIPEMMTSSEVFSQVDFDENPITRTILGYISFGLLNTSEIEKAEKVVDGLAKALDDETAQAKIEDDRWKKVRMSLKTIRMGFEDFLCFYGRLIDELEYALSMVRSSCYCRNENYFRNQTETINIYFLPKRHIECLMACDKMSRIVCEMSKRTYLSVKNGEVKVSERELTGFKKNRDAEFSVLRDKFERAA